MKSVVIFSLLILTLGITFDSVFAQSVPDPEIEEPEIVDEISPLVTVPENFVIPPENSLGAIVTFSASAFDETDGDLPVFCIPSSGSFLMKGNTTVTCTATDSSGNVGEASFVIGVLDQTPPIVSVPEDIVVDSTIVSETVVTFSASAFDETDGSIFPICIPESGATFPIGTTTVTCTATDSSGNVGEKSFAVTVNNLVTILNEELLSLQELTPEEIGNVGNHVSEFVKASNTLFQLERQGIKDLQKEFNQSQKSGESIITRSQFNSDLFELKKEISELKQEYQNIFEEYRNEVKQLVKDKKGLTVEDKRHIQNFEKAKLRIQNSETNTEENTNDFIESSLNQELKINDNKLRKLNNLIALSNYPLSGFSDSQVTKWKQEQTELHSTVKALKIVLSSSDKEQKSDIKSTIKEIKNQIKQEKEKEQQDKSDKKSNKKSGNDKGGEKSKKSSNGKGKKK